jgi:PHP family Zn ribbon phosphoesterase
MHRVEQLAAGREIPLTQKENEAGLVGFYNAKNTKRPPYVMLVPLMEILSESLKSTTASQKVIIEYENLTKNLAPEFELLTQTKIEAIEKLAGSRVAEGVKKVRKGDIVIEPGFDGVFGVVKIWPAYAKASAGKPYSNLDKAVNKQEEQMSLL